MKYTSTPKFLQHSWQRLLAVFLAAALLVTGISYSGIIAVFAKQTSGYAINVEYSEDKSKAVLKGSGKDVPENVTITGLTDAKGTDLDPKALEYSVETNGNYTFYLDYQITQEIDGGSVSEQATEEIVVKVDGIQVPEVLTEAPEVMAVSELTSRMANAQPKAEATKQFTMVTAESEQTLGTYNYTGGSIEEDMYRLSDLIPSSDPQIPDLFTNRTLKDAYFTFPDDENKYPITGLFPLTLEDGTTAWYYSPKDQTSNNNTYGVDVAVLLDETAVVYASYEITTGTQRSIVRAFDPEESNGKWNAVVNGNTSTATVYEYQMVPFSFTIPTAYSDAQITITENATGKVLATYHTANTNADSGDTANAATDKLTATNNDRTYSGIIFIPKAENSSNTGMTITFKGFTWQSNNIVKKAGIVYPRMYTENQNSNGRQNQASSGKAFDVFRIFASIESNSDHDGVEMKTVWREDLGWQNGRLNDWLVTGNKSSYMAVMSPKTGSAVANNTYNDYQTGVTVANVDDQLVSTNGKEGTKVDGEAGPLRAGTAKYTPGNTQTYKIQYEAAVLPFWGGSQASYKPVSLDLYIYLEDGLYGSDPTQSQSILTENLRLPSTQETSVTYKTKTGATVKITLNTYKEPNGSDVQNYQQRNNRADSDFGTRAMGTTYNGHFGWDVLPDNVFANWPMDMWFLNDKEPESSVVSRNTGVPYYEYTVEVTGMTCDYLFSLLDDRSDTNLVRVNTMEGVVQGEANETSSGNRILSEYTYRPNSNSDDTVGKPLATGTNLFKGKAFNLFSDVQWEKYEAWSLFLKPQMGYSRPTVTVENGNGNTVKDIYLPEADTGRYRYLVNVGTQNDASAIIPQINIQAYPITFNIKYKTEAGGESTTQTSLQPYKAPRYLVELPKDLMTAGSDQILTGFKVRVTNKEGTSAIVKTSNADGTLTNEDLVVQVQEMLELEDVYNFLTRYQYVSELGTSTQFLMSATSSGGENLNYTVTLEPQFTKGSGTIGGYITDTFTLKLQTGFASYDGTITDDNADTAYSGTGFQVNNEQFYRHSDGNAILSAPYILNYTDKTYPNAHWILSDHSKTSVVSNSQTNQLKAYYLAGVQVQFSGLGSSPSGVTDTGQQTDSGDNIYTTTEEKWYVGMSGHTSDTNNSVVDFTGIDPGTMPDRDFQGWRIANTGGESYGVISADDGLDLGEVGKTNSTLWQQIFLKDGTLKLEAVWSSMKPIASSRTNDDDNNKTLWNNQYKHPSVAEYYSGTGITVEGQFKYDFSTKDNILAEWGQNGSSKSTKASEEMSQYLDWALYGLEGRDGTAKTWSLRGDASGGSGIKTTLTLEETDDDGDGYAIATIKIDIPGNLVDYDTMSTQQFYLFAWNDASNETLGTSYDAVVHTDPNSPFNIVNVNGPWQNYGGDVVGKATASEFVSYDKMVARGITNTEDTMNVLNGNEIQWKNADSNKYFEVEFHYDNTIPWSAQSASYGDTANKSDSNAIRVVLAKRQEDGNWSKVQRFNPDSTFGTGINNEYTIELVEPTANSNTFKVKVTAPSSMTASGNEDKSQFMVVAYNFQNGEDSAPVANSNGTALDQTVQMSNIVGNLNNANFIGTKVPAVQSDVKFYPKGVKIMDNSTETLSTTVSVQKEYWQPSAEQTAVFTFDNAGYPNSYQNNTDFKDRFSPDGSNYHIALYKQDGGSWSLVESNDTEATNRKYIQSITPNTNGQVTVKYAIPADVDNGQNTTYRLMAWYGDINGNNEIQATAITPTDVTTVMANQAKLATVGITVTSTSFKKVMSSNSSAWNAKADPMSGQREYVTYSTNDASGENFVLTAQFKYDYTSKSIIQNYWDNRETTPTTDDGMGRYLNWAMYGYNPRTGQSSTWVIRDKNVTGEQESNIQKIDFDVGLSLEDDVNNSGYATAVITITIPKDEFVYNNLDRQALYLFAWNDASNKFSGEWKANETDYKALFHTDTNGESPYTFLQSTGILNSNSFGNNYGGNGPGMSAHSPVASTYWFFNVLPTAIEPVDNAAMDEPSTVTLDNSKNYQELTATFKYDTTVPWNVQSGNNNKYTTRVVIYKQKYGSTAWERVVPVNGDGNFGSWEQGSNASIQDNQDGTFTVTVRTNNLGASYDNYGAKYKIAAYNYTNYTGKMDSFLKDDGSLATEIGTAIPSATITTHMNPKPMESVGNADTGNVTGGTIGHHTFTTSKKTGEKSTITYHFQMDNASWTNSSGQANTEMQKMFDPQYQDGNVIVTLWKRDSGTGNFTFVDSYNGGTPTALGDNQDGIVNVTAIDHSGYKELEVEIQSGTDSNTDGTEYRVFAWYASSNSKNWNLSNIKDPDFAAADPTTVRGVVPYSTARMDMNFETPTYYIIFPGLTTMYDDQGNVKVNDGTGETDLSDQYAGASAEVKYDADKLSGTVPEISVSVTDNTSMALAESDALSAIHKVGVYFQDGYKNNVLDPNNDGMVSLGILSTSRSQAADSSTQTTPIGQSLPFYLNTLQGYDGEKYVAKLTFHCNNLPTTP